MGHRLTLHEKCPNTELFQYFEEITVLIHCSWSHQEYFLGFSLNILAPLE